MGKRKIAILLNALILPGAGHFYAGLRLRGAMLALACIAFITLPVIKYAMAFSYTLDMMDITGNLNFYGIMAEALVRAWADVRTLSYLALAGLFIVWLFSIIDIVLKTRGTNGGVQSVEKQG